MKRLVWIFVIACGSHSNGTSGDGGGGGTSDGFPGCHQLTEACSADGDCCSDRCAAGQCLPAGTCTAPGESCVDGPTNTCCSGRCEPVQGETGVTQCIAECVADGQTCAKATDCCSLDCHGGVCGGAECAQESQTCATNADCCSNICKDTGNGLVCQLDAANTTCRGIGENCSSGPQSGCCSMVCDKQTQRCDAGSATCAAQNGACTVDTDCCHGTCDTTTHTCEVACVAASGACTTDAECCTSVCTNGSCADLGSACGAVGSACTAGAQCCSDICTGGFCEQLIL